MTLGTNSTEKARRRRAFQLPLVNTIEIFVQKGEFGFHAGTRPVSRIWAAHKTDPATAAYRAAIRHWFGPGNLENLTYDQARSITLVRNEPQRFTATKDEVQIPTEFTPDSQLAKDARAAKFPLPTGPGWVVIKVPKKHRSRHLHVTLRKGRRK